MDPKLSEIAQQCLDDLDAGKMPSRVLRRFLQGVAAPCPDEAPAPKPASKKKA